MMNDETVNGLAVNHDDDDGDMVVDVVARPDGPIDASWGLPPSPLPTSLIVR
jgi:hypothetical protein